jgi:hypothetical protein
MTLFEEGRLDMGLAGLFPSRFPTKFCCADLLGKYLLCVVIWIQKYTDNEV